MTTGLLFMVPLGLAVAAAVRVGTQLGARDPAGARRTVAVSLALAGCLAASNAGFIFAVRSWWGRLFTAAPGVVALVARWIVLLLPYETFDALQVRGGTGSRGLSRGCHSAATSSRSRAGRRHRVSSRHRPQRARGYREPRVLWLLRAASWVAAGRARGVGPCRGVGRAHGSRRHVGSARVCSAVLGDRLGSRVCDGPHSGTADALVPLSQHRAASDARVYRPDRPARDSEADSVRVTHTRMQPTSTSSLR